MRYLFLNERASRPRPKRSGVYVSCRADEPTRIMSAEELDRMLALDAMAADEDEVTLTIKADGLPVFARTP